MNKILLLFCFLNLFGCSGPSQNKGQARVYKMVSYQSKAFIDTVKFPLIKIFADNTFEIYMNEQMISKGFAAQKENKLVFLLDNKKQLHGTYVEDQHNIIRLRELTNINIKANDGDFQKVE